MSISTNRNRSILGLAILSIIGYLSTVMAVDQCDCKVMDVCFEKYKTSKFVQAGKLKNSCRAKLSEANKKAVSTCEQKVFNEKASVARSVVQKKGTFYEESQMCGSKKFKKQKATTPEIPESPKGKEDSSPKPPSSGGKNFPSFITQDVQDYLACMKAGPASDAEEDAPPKDPWLCPKSESPLDVIKKLKKGSKGKSGSSKAKSSGESLMRKLIKCAADKKCCLNLNSDAIAKVLSGYKKQAAEEKKVKLKTDPCECLGTELGVDAATVQAECNPSRRKRFVNARDQSHSLHVTNLEEMWEFFL